MTQIEEKIFDMDTISAAAKFAFGSLIISLLLAATNVPAAPGKKVIQTQALTLTGNRAADDEKKSRFLPYKSTEKVITTKSLIFTGNRKQ